ncbi:hypothetical protein NKR23_g1250 [Pleurostoma richardsiae]|uniref:Uncharacterized protein n=1 Tax=Pleurostoma richardsiae TaxID=41990 RepID=A0AA38VWD4_9PEZI|nr:hypothetical protein NKR23_g1250 [Pleurostoma richardsiae]
MTDCTPTQGNAAMYGLGIRTGFYLQCPAEIYVVLLLVFGSFYLTIPLFLWRLITGCSPNWDPSRWPRAPSSPGLSVVSFLLSLVLLGYQMWFWTAGVKERRLDCQQYGFLFAKIPIDNGGFIAWNILFNIAFLLGGMWGLCVAMALIRGYRKKPKRRLRRVHIEALQQLQSTFELIVATLMTVAVELVIQWNHLKGVSDVSTAAQLIPTLVSAGFLARIFFIWMTRPDGGSPKSGSSMTSPSSSSSRRRYGAGPGTAPEFVTQSQGPASQGRGLDSHISSEMAMSTAASTISGEMSDQFPQMPPMAAVPGAGASIHEAGGMSLPPYQPMPAFMSGGIPSGGAPPPHPAGGMPPPPF